MKLSGEMGGGLTLSETIFALRAEQFMAIMNLPDATTPFTSAFSSQNHQASYPLGGLGVVGIKTTVAARHNETTLTNR